MRQEYRVAGLGAPLSHYTDAVRFGNLVFLAGQIAVDADWNVVGKGDAVEQTRKIFDNMKLVLDEIGAGFGDVLRLTFYMRNVEDRPKIDPVRQEVFGDVRPAATLVEVSKLAHPDLLLEIDAVVGLPED